ncbi:hypothetical protein PoB_007450800 [Plakobranchus ocellatus]|uniref:CCHC-type domain-containing protein n=1 Tax=Plakobranchus ocellatus TaxID=259542 RepID=A0AAV4DUQ0_9GAST|nr:hypothetical protein PoB_007450800 [Plakobranchus ocellatus]
MARNFETINSRVNSQAKMNIDAVNFNSHRKFSSKSQDRRKFNFKQDQKEKRSSAKPAKYKTSSTKFDSARVYNRCHRCSRNHGPRDQCPAMGKTCHICSKPNHFAVACRSVKPHTSQHRKTVNDLTQLDQHDTCTDSESDSGEFFPDLLQGPRRRTMDDRVSNKRKGLCHLQN